MDSRPRHSTQHHQDAQHAQVEITTAMIDRLVHHAEVIALKGDSYRLKDRDLGRVPTATPAED